MENETPQNNLIQDELKMKSPIDLQTSTFLNLTRSYFLLAQECDRLFKGNKLTRVTYNILRILRGSQPDGLTCADISARLLTRVPDLTRLIDRLVKLDLVKRERKKEDRRKVIQTITEKGLDLIEGLDKPLKAIHQKQFQHMEEEDLEQLSALLEKARAPLSRPEHSL